MYIYCIIIMKDVNILIDGLSVGSKKLLDKTEFIIAEGHKYGFIGKNGLGKTTVINHLFNHETLKDVYKYMVNQEIESSDTKTAFQTVLESNTELLELHTKSLELENKIGDEGSIPDVNIDDKLYDEYNLINEKLHILGFEREQALIRKILHGLGFEHDRQDITINNFSGGWRMRLALACALYRAPDLLLLDEPTNHLDLEANIWLIDYLKSYKKTIIVISHDIDFLDNVCNWIIHLENFKLNYYKGGFYKFKKAYDKQIKENMKEVEKIEKKIKELKKNSKNKNEMENYIKKNPLPFIPYDKNIIIDFGEVPSNYNNLITLDNVSFSYGENEILRNLDFSVSTKTRITLVGKNGSGKSTLMKLLAGEQKSNHGNLTLDERVKISYFNQHTFEYLPEDITPVEYLLKKFSKDELKEDVVRSYLGRIGLDGKIHKIRIGDLSGGQKVRVALVELQLLKPDLLLLDEPTNHMDLYTIEALKKAINEFEGGVVIISHNIDLITDTNCEIYEMTDKKCVKTTFEDYTQKILED